MVKNASSHLPLLLPLEHSICLSRIPMQVSEMDVCTKHVMLSICMRLVLKGRVVMTSFDVTW